MKPTYKVYSFEESLREMELILDGDVTTVTEQNALPDDSENIVQKSLYAYCSVIYIDKNYLLLYRTNTGYLSLKRLYRDYIEPEINYIGFDDDDEVTSNDNQSVDDFEIGDDDYDMFNVGENKSIGQEIKNLSPELKALLIDNVLNKKTDDDKK